MHISTWQSSKFKQRSPVPDVCCKFPSLFILQNINVFSKQGDHAQSGKIYETVFLKPQFVLSSVL